MNGILSQWECPSCGNIIKLCGVIFPKADKYYFEGPTKCGCGRKGKFKLLNFEPMDVAIYGREDDALIIPHKVSDMVREFAYKKLKEEENKNEN